MHQQQQQQHHRHRRRRRRRHRVVAVVVVMNTLVAYSQGLPCLSYPGHQNHCGFLQAASAVWHSQIAAEDFKQAQVQRTYTRHPTCSTVRY